MIGLHGRIYAPKPPDHFTRTFLIVFAITLPVCVLLELVGVDLP